MKLPPWVTLLVLWVRGNRRNAISCQSCLCHYRQEIRSRHFERSTLNDNAIKLLIAFSAVKVVELTYAQAIFFLSTDSTSPRYKNSLDPTSAGCPFLGGGSYVYPCAFFAC
eukprot:scaffold9213_cov125-Skeletonema_dohrnii-CCMP3373.AAC.1